MDCKLTSRKGRAAEPYNKSLEYIKQLLTQIKMCCRSVTVQFGIKFFIFAVYFNSFCIEVNGAVEIFLVVFIVTLILVNLCNCYNEVN